MCSQFDWIQWWKAQKKHIFIGSLKIDKSHGCVCVSAWDSEGVNGTKERDKSFLAFSYLCGIANPPQSERAHKNCLPFRVIVIADKLKSSILILESNELCRANEKKTEN